MAEILCRWVNTDIEPEPELVSETLSYQLSNGYPYGLILFRYGMQEDFHNFHRGHSSEAKLNNFTRLEPSLRLLNIYLKPQSVSEIINQRGHAAIQLLYRLFVCLGSSRSEMKSIQTHKTSMKQTDSSESKWYRDRLRRQTLRQSDLDFEALVRGYEDKRNLEERSLREREEQFEKEEISARQMKIAEQLTEGRMRRERQAQLYRSLKLSPIKSVQGATPASFGSDRRPRSLNSRQNKRKEAREVSLLLEDFEKKQVFNLVYHGSSELPPISKSSLTADVQPPVISGGSESSLNSSSTSSEAGSLAEPDNRYVARLQARGSAKREMAQMRAARRRRILAEQLRREECKADEQKEELLVKRLMRQSQQEQRAATQLLQIKQNKEVIRENRANRQKQLEEERRREFSEALDREAQLAAAEKELYADQIKQQQELHRELLLQKEKKSAEKSRVSCQEMVLLFVDLACKIAEYREMTDKQIPAKVFRTWKSLVLAGYSPFQNEAEEDYPTIMTPVTSPVPPTDQEDLEQKALLDERDFLAYLCWQEEWSESEEDTRLTNPPNLILKHLISRLYSAAFPPPPLPTPPDLPSFQFTGCLIGPPFSGKTTILSQLTQRTGIVVLDITKLVNEAIQAHRSNEMEEVKCEPTPVPPEAATQSFIEKPDKSKSMSGKKQKQIKGVTSGTAPPRNVSSRTSAKKEEEQVQNLIYTGTPSPDTSLSQLVPTPRAVLGKLAYEMMRRGDSLDDSVLIGLFLQKIKELPDGCSWIIDGFPKTLSQAQLLEKQLSGYEQPSNLPKLRTSREAREWGGTKISILAQGLEHEQLLTAPTSYLNRIIVLNLPDKLAIRRGLGQQVNKRTKDRYHVEFNPAPSSVKQSDLSRSNSNKLDILQYLLANYTDNQPALEEWFNRFGNAQYIEGANTISNLATKVEEILSLSISPPLPVRSVSPDAPDNVTDSKQSTGDDEKPVVRPGELGWEHCSRPIPDHVCNFLAKLWDSTEDHYIAACKEVFSALRQTQHISCKYIYQTRVQFREYLRRPDQKQIIVTQFQKKYNELSADLRADNDVKAEFHLQVDELKKDRLWEISDTRKHSAELERAHIMENNWLEDNTGYLINLFISLLQAELSRFQDTLRVIHDYYESMRGRALSEFPAQVVVPLLELPDAQAVLESISGTCIPQTSTEEEAGVGEGEGVEEQNKSVKRPFLMPRYEYRVDQVSSREDKGKKKLDKRASEKSFVSSTLELSSEDPDEHQLLQAYCLTFNNLQNICNSEYFLKEEVELERIDKDRKEVDDKTKVGKVTPGKKGGKATPVGGKKGAKPTVPTPEPVVSDTQLPPEVVQARKDEDYLLEEFMEAVKLEENYTKYRLEQLRSRGVAMVRELKSKVTELYKEMNDWIGMRFNEEISSINNLSQYIHQAIENEIRIKHVLNLSGTEFLIESSMVTYEDPPKPRPTTPPEDVASGSLTVMQLEALVTSLSLSAPSGVISIQEFIQFLTDNFSKSSFIPKFSAEQLSFLTLISWDGHYINWKNFVVSLALPYPAPTLHTLMDTLLRFRERYPTGQVNKGEYLEEHLWFESYPRDPAEYDDLDAQLKFDRDFMIRNVFFEIYADPNSGLLDYEDMLLYFCADAVGNDGLINALSLLKGIEIPLPDSATTEETSSIYFSKELLFKAFYHNQIEGKQSDISSYSAPLDLTQLFSDLDTSGTNELTYAQLLSYPPFTKVVHTSTLYHLFDPSVTLFNTSPATTQHSEINLLEHPLN